MSWHEIEVYPVYLGKCVTKGCSFTFTACSAGASEDVARDHIDSNAMYYSHEIDIMTFTRVGRK